jgi:hypothetical protein
MNETIINAIRASLLFAADKYRKVGDILKRFDDPNTEQARSSERTFRRAAVSVAHAENMNAVDLGVSAIALTARADELNRKVQLLADRCQMQESAVVAHELRGVYDALDVVATLRAGGTVRVADATDTVE